MLAFSTSCHEIGAAIDDGEFGWGQYSIWPADRELPAGWCAEGMVGTRSECLAHIDRVWTDVRPLSLRRSMKG
jgi:MbtH protein